MEAAYVRNEDFAQIFQALLALLFALKDFLHKWPINEGYTYIYISASRRWRQPDETSGGGCGCGDGSGCIVFTEWQAKLAAAGRSKRQSGSVRCLPHCVKASMFGPPVARREVRMVVKERNVRRAKLKGAPPPAVYINPMKPKAETSAHSLEERTLQVDPTGEIAVGLVVPREHANFIRVFSACPVYAPQILRHLLQQMQGEPSHSRAAGGKLVKYEDRQF